MNLIFRSVPSWQAGFLFGSICIAVPFPVVAQEAIPAECAVPPDLFHDDPRLSEVAQRIAAREPITIVAIGGSSTAGGAAGGVDKAYPRQLEMALRRRYPDANITVLNKGVANDTAAQMVRRFDKDIMSVKPSLAIWETGITEATREADIDEFTRSLQEGIHELKAQHIDVMLMDMQYSPDTASVIDFQPYLDALREAADVEGIYVFRRYDIMQYWNDKQMFRMSGVAKKDQQVLAGEIYHCLGELMAEAIVFAARPDQ